MEDHTTAWPGLEPSLRRNPGSAGTTLKAFLGRKDVASVTEAGHVDGTRLVQPTGPREERLRKLPNLPY